VGVGIAVLKFPIQIIASATVAAVSIFSHFFLDPPPTANFGCRPVSTAVGNAAKVVLTHNGNFAE